MRARWVVLSAGAPSPEVLAVVFAQAVNAADPVAQLTGYGALGIVVIGAVTGWIRFKPEVAALREDMAKRDLEHAEERRRLQAQIESLLGVHQQQVLPALLASAEALRTSAEQSTAVINALERVNQTTSLIERSMGRGDGR